MKDSFSCILVDDEPKVVGLLLKCLQDLYNNIEVLGTYNTWNTALPVLRNSEFDILFLDISMPGKTGMDLLSMLPGLKAEVIFITAHAEFALKAFQFSPTGYVLKPIDDKDLAGAVDKAMERIRYRRLASQNGAVPLNSKIGIPNSTGVDYVDMNEILFLEATNKCTHVVAVKNEITSSYSLTRFMSLLDQQLFYQVHRSFIINLNFIKRYETNGSVTMSNGKEVPIAKHLREDFLLKFHKVTKSD